MGEDVTGGGSHAPRVIASRARVARSCRACSSCAREPEKCARTHKGDDADESGGHRGLEGVGLVKERRAEERVIDPRGGFHRDRRCQQKERCARILRRRVLERLPKDSLSGRRRRVIEGERWSPLSLRRETRRGARASRRRTKTTISTASQLATRHAMNRGTKSRAASAAHSAGG